MGAPAGSPGQVKFTGGTGSGAWHPLTPSWVPASMSLHVFGLDGVRDGKNGVRGLASPDPLVGAAQHFAGTGAWEGSEGNPPQERTAFFVLVRVIARTCTMSAGLTGRKLSSIRLAIGFGVHAVYDVGAGDQGICSGWVMSPRTLCL